MDRKNEPLVFFLEVGVSLEMIEVFHFSITLQAS
jgi:hypothetical protein